MLQLRVPIIRTVLAPSSVSFQYFCSSAVMSVHYSTNAVETSGASPVDTPKDDHETIGRQQTGRGRIDLKLVRKHLGIKQPTATTNHDNRFSLSVNTSSDNHTSQMSETSPFKTCGRSLKRNTDTSPLSSSSGCSLETEQNRKSGSTRNCELSEECLLDDQYARMLEERSLPTSFGKRVPDQPRKLNTSGSTRLKHRDTRSCKGAKQNKRCAAIEPFDICPFQTEDCEVRRLEIQDPLFLRSSEDVTNEAEVNQIDQLSDEQEPRKCVLWPGMLLLKGFITHDEQVSVVRKCRELGLHQGGFYRPGYKDGAKLRLYMMCLGLDWDPQTRKYQKRRHFDRSKPPSIPFEFHSLVDRAMEYSHALIRRELKVSNAEDILPQMSPDVCIVNFYTEAGRLGLHQDRDESTESLSKGLPVVSFSVGNSAEFLYGNERDLNKAKKLVLESGDVLIFGGESRHVFHGVASIIPDSAPSFLLEETGLRPGRLNLTFRQY